MDRVPDALSRVFGQVKGDYYCKSLLNIYAATSGAIMRTVYLAHSISKYPHEITKM